MSVTGGTALVTAEVLPTGNGDSTERMRVKMENVIYKREKKGRRTVESLPVNHD